MELIRVNLARAIWLFDTGELNPRGANIYPVFDELIRKYRFQTFPDPKDLRSGKDRRFAEGVFIADSQSINVSLEIWTDGLVADTYHSTEASEKLLCDVIGWASAKLGAPDPRASVNKKVYRSEVVVQAHRGLTGVCDRLDRFAAILKDAMDEPLEPSAFIFGSEGQTSSFTFERRISEPFESNKFFSAAQTQTKIHLDLLNRLEEIFAEKAE